MLERATKERTGPARRCGPRPWDAVSCESEVPACSRKLGFQLSSSDAGLKTRSDPKEPRARLGRGPRSVEQLIEKKASIAANGGQPMAQTSGQQSRASSRCHLISDTTCLRCPSPGA